MLADAVAVEVSGHAGQFDLAMQRLVRYAKQGSVRYAEAEPVGGHRSRFHVEGDGTRLRQAPNGRYVVTELPIPVVDAGYRAGPHHPFELKPAQPRHFADGLLERDLHLGQRRNRHPQRQLLIQHVILADVSVSEDVIAELLRVAQPGTMAEHQPGVGPKHCDVVGDVARVRRTGSNVDHADAVGSLLNQMKSRHLRRAFRRDMRGTWIAEARFGRDDITWLDKGFGHRITGRHALAADAREG